jgi:hypothetical protein
MLYFNFLFILPTGNTSPALEDADRLFDASTVLPSFPDFPLLLAVNGFESGFDFTLEREAAFVTAAIGLEELDVLAGTVVVGAVNIGAGAGTIGLLSKSVSGTRETVKAIEELVYASFPLLSKVSKIEIVGKIANIFSRYPGSFETGLLIKSSCNNCLRLPICSRCSNF